MGDIRVRRLDRSDLSVARDTFAMMVAVFEEDADAAVGEPLSDEYLDDLLRQDSFWALAAFDGDEIVGGITAHVLQMTRSEASEMFIYDLAVREDHQRRGIGTRLIEELRAQAAAAGIHEVFVPADNEDTHAVDFYRALGGIPAAVTHFTFTDPG